MAASNSTRGGFTLIEILVVIVILGLLAAVVIPSVANTGQMQVHSAAAMLTSDIQYAQSLAISSQRPVTISFSPSGDYYTVHWSNESDPLEHPIRKKAYVVNFRTEHGFERVELVSASFGGTTDVMFDELGAPDNAGSVVLRAGATVYTVSVASATGKVTVSRSG